jgi:stearoyl-CoA desaturase (Delta-9 desaturase)
MSKRFKYQIKNLSKLNTLFLFLTPLASLILTIVWIYVDGFDWRLVALGIIFYVLSGISITAGYHRLFAHRAYAAHPIIKIFFLIFGASAFQNSALKWASDHRIHHGQVDTEQDPYNINEGFFYAHMGWILLKANGDFKDDCVKDLLKDKWVVFQHKHIFTIGVCFGIILPSFLGYFFFDSLLGGIAVGSLFKVVLLHHCTFFINSLCHYVGNRPYTDTNTAKDSWFMALLTFGEGYHNFHHYFQADYRNGVRWFHFDPTKWTISLLEKFHLASKLKKTPNFKIISAKLQMKLQSAKKRYKFDDTKFLELERIKNNVIRSLKKFEEMKNQYAREKNRLAQDKLIELKRQIEIAKIEFQYNLRTLNVLLP